MKSKVEQYNDLMSSMSKAKEEIEHEAANEKDYMDEKERKQNELLSNAIELALEQGRGWGPGEKEAYLERILDDDFIPPLFASNAAEVEKSGLQEAFTSLIYDGEPPTRLMNQFRQKGNEAFKNGKRNVNNNNQYYRDAITHYYEAYAWALKVEPMMEGDLAQADTDDPTYNEQELFQARSTLCTNAALAHAQLKNWGHVRDQSKLALEWDKKNIKAWYRLATAYQNLQAYEDAGDAIDQGLALDPAHKELLKLQKLLAERIRKAKLQRQQRERKRAERIAKIKGVWKHCQQENIMLGRIPLVSTVNDDNIDNDDDGKDDHMESQWNKHMPHSGKLPVLDSSTWYWPCVFLYPSHQQSDFVEKLSESDMLALQMAQMFPELDEETNETSISWDDKNEFTCSNLVVYFEVHPITQLKQEQDQKGSDGDKKALQVHPSSVELIASQSAAVQLYESQRALLGDEGSEMAQVVRLHQQQTLYQKRQEWKKRHGNLYAHRPDHNPVVRVHPAVTLRDVLTDTRHIAANFLVTFLLFPESHPAHQAYLKEHSCIGTLMPKEMKS